MDEDGNMASVETPTFLATGGTAGDGMGGMGGMGVLLGALLAGGLGGFNGRRNDGGEGCVTPSQLTSGLTGVTDAIQNTEVMGQLADIKAAVPLAEANMQLALAGAQAQITSEVNTANIANLQGQAGLSREISAATAMLTAGQGAIKESIAAYGVANLNATKDAQYATLAAIKEDGEKTRESVGQVKDLITSNQILDLQRQLGVAEARGQEDRLLTSNRQTEVNVTQIVEQNNRQAAIQASNQQQAQLLASLASAVNNLAFDVQNIRASNQAINIGAGNLAANPTNTNTNVRA